ncbi:MAG: hypothetical protein AAFY06_15555, partial [Pseudomonadota bacterium]
RDISISTEVFASIWSLRNVGEESEDEILKRILKAYCSEEHGTLNTKKQVSGLTDMRNGVTFPEGFEVFRTYKKRLYRARIVNGQWQVFGLDGRFSTLNEISKAIGTSVENAWMNWLFENEEGKRMTVSELREPTSIQRRRHTSDPKVTDVKEIRWCDDVRMALTSLGGEATLQEIYDQVIAARKFANRTLPKSTEAIIRKELETRSSDSQAYDYERGEDWFELRGEKGKGLWGLR